MNKAFTTILTGKSVVTRAIYILLLPLLVLPFTGVKASTIIFIVLSMALLTIHILKRYNIKTCVSIPSSLKKALKRPLLLTFCMVILIIPLIPSSQYVTDVLALCLIYSILASGLNVIVGMTGLLHLGFAAFYAIGAYTHALLTIHWGFSFWVSAPVSAALSALTGLVLAFPALRLRGDYLAIVTLGFGEILRIILNNWKEVTNGPNGISSIPAPSLFGISLGNISHFTYLALIFAVISLFVIQRVEESRIGRAWHAIREDETTALSLGIDVTAYKLMSFSFGSFWAGLAGALFASKMGFISPESFTFIESVMILCMVILGGLGNRYGAVAGAFILIGIPELLRDVHTYRMLLVGLGLVVMMLYMPQGIAGWLKLHVRPKD